MSGLPAIDQYLLRRDQERLDAVNRLAGAFTYRELRLMKEAAVMGYVQGVRNGPHRETIPHDRDILTEVLDACLHNPDLYPVIAHANEGCVCCGTTDNLMWRKGDHELAVATVCRPCKFGACEECR